MNLKNVVAAIEIGIRHLSYEGDDFAIFEAIDKLHNALKGGDDLIEHIMNVEDIEDDFLFRLWQRIGSYIVDAAASDNIVDSVRIQLTTTCEAVLEALSSAPRPNLLGKWKRRPKDAEDELVEKLAMEMVEEIDDDIEEELEDAVDEFEDVKKRLERLEKLENVLAKTVSTLLFVLKYAIKRDSLPAASRHARELEDEARRVGIRGLT